MPYSPSDPIKHTVEFRSMHNACHGLLVFDDGPTADWAFELLDNAGDESLDIVLEHVREQFEIDHRDVGFDEGSRWWAWTDPHDGTMYVIENVGHQVPDLYLTV